MNRTDIYNRWLTTVYTGQDGCDVPLCNDTTIQKFNLINDFNFQCYSDYQDYYVGEHELSSIPSIRSKIIKFLLSDTIINKTLDSVTEEELDCYFFSQKDEVVKQTYDSIISFLSGFYEFLQNEKNIHVNFNSEKYRQWSLECLDGNQSSAKALDAKQISEIRNHFNDSLLENSKYREYLYVFDMLYYTEFSKHEIKTLSLNDNVDISTNTITFGDISTKVPNAVIANIIELDKLGLLGSLLNVSQYILNMKSIVEEYDFDNIRIKDIKKTREKRFITCPRCGKCFEATIDNWCGKQYCENGEIWIVCKECGNE